MGRDASTGDTHQHGFQRGSATSWASRCALCPYPTGWHTLSSPCVQPLPLGKYRRVGWSLVAPIIPPEAVEESVVLEGMVITHCIYQVSEEHVMLRTHTYTHVRMYKCTSHTRTHNHCVWALVHTHGYMLAIRTYLHTYTHQSTVNSHLHIHSQPALQTHTVVDDSVLQ